MVGFNWFLSYFTDTLKARTGGGIIFSWSSQNLQMGNIYLKSGYLIPVSSLKMMTLLLYKSNIKVMTRDQSEQTVTE